MKNLVKSVFLGGECEKKLMGVALAGLPPTVNHLYRTSAQGVRYKTADGRKWQERAARAMLQDYGGGAPYGGDVAAFIVFQTADRRRWDIDNRVKALLDCIQMAGVLKDDTQVQVLHVRRVERPRPPKRLREQGVEPEKTVTKIEVWTLGQ